VPVALVNQRTVLVHPDGSDRPVGGEHRLQHGRRLSMHHIGRVEDVYHNRHYGSKNAEPLV
jgi:hypothetical protein